jgi:GT2 family glycosyltransferase
MSFRKQVIVAVGGFDENFVGSAIGEDTEFSYRARRLGLIRYSPAAYLVHLRAPSGGTRAAAGRANHIGHIAFCTNYFWFKVGARNGFRCRRTIQTFRQQVLNRHTLRNGRWLPFAAAFLRGIRDSERVIRQLRVERRWQ